MNVLDEKTKSIVIKFQKNEITEYYIYQNLSRMEKNEKNKKTLSDISNDEKRHYGMWKKYSGKEVKPFRFKILFYIFLAKLLGLTFAVKLMEGGEENAQKAYSDISKIIPEAEQIYNEENGHEKQLIDMIDEDKLNYIGSIVLGLNDALVELTGTLAGLTFALQNSKLIGMAGLITGIAASLSMAASEYLSTKSEGGDRNPFKASFYTGVAYVIAVIVLITPYLLLNNYFLAFSLALTGAIIIIFVFTFYFSVVKEISFKTRFVEMAGISLGVAGLSFIIGLVVRHFLGVEI